MKNTYLEIKKYLCLHKKVKTFLFPLVCRFLQTLLFFFCFFFFCLQNTSFAIDNDSSELIRISYGFDREFPPFSYQEAGGEPVGFDIDLAKAIFNGPDVVLSFRPLQWENVLLELSSGEINLASGFVHSSLRERLYLFPEKASFSLQIKLFTKVYDRYPSISFLRGQRVSVEQGTYQQRLLDNYGGIIVVPYKSKVDGLKALYNDEVAAYCAPTAPTYYYINKLRYGAITTIGTPLGVTDLSFAVNRSRGDILQILNDGLTKIMSNGEYDRIYKKWFVRDISNDEVTLLKETAKNAAISAYTPYGAEAQGAAIISSTGKVYKGCTVENADASLTISALENALASAVEAGEYEFYAAGITDQSGNIIQASQKDLQTLYEFGRGILILYPEAASDARAFMVAEKITNPIARVSPSIPRE